MKLGIITDIHSNMSALKAVLKEFEKLRIDKIICCGDIIGIGPNPEEVVQELIKIEDKLIVVRGNHEQYLIEGLPKVVHDNKRKMSVEEIKNHEWTHCQLSFSSKAFIERLSLSEKYFIENQTIHIEHYPTNGDGKYKTHIKQPTDNEIKDLFSAVKENIFLYGHTHATCEKCVENIYYINPGSLGCPMAGAYANCGILTLENTEIKYEHLNVNYDIENVIKEIERKKYPDYNNIINIFFGEKNN